MSIICHKHKFIFLKTRKTAGTSLQVGFSQVCDDGDTCTYISQTHPSYKIRGNPLPSVRGRSHNYPEIIKEIFPKEWETYRKIVPIRNPYHVAVSTAIYSGMHDVTRARTWIREHLDWLDNEKFIYPFDGSKIDHFIRFENLQEDYQKTSFALGFKPQPMPHLRRRARHLGFSFSDVLDEPTRITIYEHFKKSIEEFYP